MHPSKVQQSTCKQPDSGLVLGFRPIEMDPNASGAPVSPLLNTPSKGRLSHADQLAALSCDFKFSCESPALSLEARQIMEGIRGDAARIKAELIMKEKEEKAKEDETIKAGERKIARAKGKMGRFSEIHMAQFKKMDSIANHPSSFRARADRIQPPASKNLKRTVAKACLDEPERPSPTKAQATTPAKATANLATKRIRSMGAQDVSSRRPLVKDDQAANKPGATVNPKTEENPVTPHKPAIVRSTSVKYSRTSNVPLFSRSPSKPNLAPKTPQTDLKAKPKSSIPTFGTLKSILRRRQPLFSDDPVKIAAGTHQPFPNADLTNKLLFVPDMDADSSSAVPSSKKRVDFSDSTKFPDVADGSIEVPKTPDYDSIAEDASGGEIVYPTLPPLSTPQDNKTVSFFFEPSPTANRKTPATASPRRQLIFSTPGAVPHGITSKKRQREDSEDKEAESEAPEPVQRSAKRVKTFPAPAQSQTPSPVKQRPLQYGTPRSVGRMAPSSAQRKSSAALSLSRLSFLARPKQRR